MLIPAATLNEPTVKLVEVSVLNPVPVAELKIASLDTVGTALRLQLLAVPSGAVADPVQVFAVFCAVAKLTEAARIARKLKFLPSFKTGPAIFQTGRSGRRAVLSFLVNLQMGWKRAPLNGVAETRDGKETLGAPVVRAGRSSVRCGMEWSIV